MSGMVSRYYRLPSLNALHAFEAAARLQSVSRAARELNVTSGAVSKQIKALEAELGVELFRRGFREVALTADGEALALSLGEAFTRMGEAVGAVRGSSGVNHVVVSTTNAFAQMWLMPRLGRFWQKHPELGVDHAISDRPEDFARADADLKIRYGDGDWPGEAAVRLFGDRIILVASPGYAKSHRIKTVKDLDGLTLLDTGAGGWVWTRWPQFLASQGAILRKPRHKLFNSYMILLQAAQGGNGVGLGWERLVAPLIAEGKLVRVTASVMEISSAYYLTHTKKRPLSAAAQSFRDWIVAEARSVEKNSNVG